ncbi:MAG: KTSC domain-containing protein [Pseudomonadota bacterium]
MEVDSTAIQAIDYDAHHGKLLIRFVSGERYIYVGVPGEVHRSFVDAESKGSFFQAEIRDQYPYNRLEA